MQRHHFSDNVIYNEPSSERRLKIQELFYKT